MRDHDRRLLDRAGEPGGALRGLTIVGMLIIAWVHGKRAGELRYG